MIDIYTKDEITYLANITDTIFLSVEVDCKLEYIDTIGGLYTNYSDDLDNMYDTHTYLIVEDIHKHGEYICEGETYITYTETQWLLTDEGYLEFKKQVDRERKLNALLDL